MTKLNQILAIEKGVKATSTRLLTDLHRKSQTAALYEGRDRNYQPLSDDGERFPPESQKVQLRGRNVLKELQTSLSELFDVTFTKDMANLKSSADVVVEGKTLLRNVPVTYLLFLEKQLTDIHTFVSKLPVLDSSENWTWDDAQSSYRTSPVETAKTKKITKPVVLYEATKEHPAQVKEVSEDVVVGYWKSIRYSAALSQQKKDDLMERVNKLHAAVKFAREEANGCEAPKLTVADSVFSYIFGESQ